MYQGCRKGLLYQGLDPTGVNDTLWLIACTFTVFIGPHPSVYANDHAIL